MRATYRGVASLIALGVLVQAGSVAYAWFQTLSDVDAGQVFDQNVEGNVGHMLHGIVGMMVIPVLALVLVGVSFAAARDVPRARAWAGIVLGLVVLQVGLAFISFGVPLVGALHGVNALLVLGAASRAAALTRAPASADGSAAGGIPAQRSGSTSRTTGADLPG